VKDFKDLTIIVDSREKVNQHITSYLDELPCKYIVQKLDFGDYSAQTDINGQTYSLADKVVIERKASLDELATNITSQRARFEREFKRASEKGAKVYLVIEDASWGDITFHRYRSQMNPKAYMATLWAWQEHYNITVNFIPKAMSGMFIKGTLHYAMRDYILSGGN
jgi:ERCC4-type nuclease